MNGIIFESIGFCIIASLIAWSFCSAFLKRLLKLQLTIGIQAITLIGTHIMTSIIVALLGPPLSFGVSFMVAFILTPLSLLVTSKKFGTEWQGQ